MNMDAELDLWREQWKSPSGMAVPADLRKRVARQSRAMRIMLVSDILVTVLIGGGATAWLIQAPRTETVVLAVAVWLFIAAAWIFGMSNRKGAWSPAASSTSAYLDLSLRRCRANLRAVRFGAVLYFAEIVFSLSWVYHDLSQREPLPAGSFLTSTLVLIVWLCTGIFVVGLIWFWRRKRAELKYLLDMKSQLATDEHG